MGDTVVVNILSITNGVYGLKRSCFAGRIDAAQIREYHGDDGDKNKIQRLHFDRQVIQKINIRGKRYPLVFKLPIADHESENRAEDGSDNPDNQTLRGKNARDVLIACTLSLKDADIAALFHGHHD